MKLFYLSGVDQARFRSFPLTISQPILTNEVSMESLRKVLLGCEKIFEIVL